MCEKALSSTFFELSPKDWQRALFLIYQDKVRKLSEKNFRSNDLKNKEFRGKGYSLDHKISIKECYDKKIPVEIAGDILNLEMVPEEHNREKGARSSILFEELINAISERDELI